jgi:predicted lactoylglutathione lyase
MAKGEETTLEKMKVFQDAAEGAQKLLETANEKITALAAGTNANIDNVVVKLLSEGTVYLAFAGGDSEFVFSERQFLGLMGWGRKHVGDGPGKVQNAE